MKMRAPPIPSSPADAPDTANTAMAISNTFIGRLSPAQIARELFYYNIYYSIIFYYILLFCYSIGLAPEAVGLPKHLLCHGYQYCL